MSARPIRPARGAPAAVADVAIEHADRNRAEPRQLWLTGVRARYLYGRFVMVHLAGSLLRKGMPVQSIGHGDDICP